MIVLPARKRLIARRNALYKRLQGILQHASVSEVEGIMRKIHCINFKLINYFGPKKEEENEEW